MERSLLLCSSQTIYSPKRANFNDQHNPFIVQNISEVKPLSEFVGGTEWFNNG